MKNKSTIKKIELAEQGLKKIQWAAGKMDILNQIKKEQMVKRPLAGKNVAICLHLEAKTAYMALVLKELGANVAICGSNPLSTQDDVAAALVKQEIEVHSFYGATSKEYKEHLGKVLATKPNLIIDDGGDLVEALHTEYRDLLADIIGGSEETTTGILRLKSMEKEKVLEFPMMAVNDADCKYLFDNRYGTGQSVWDGILRTTNLVIAGKNVVIAGYGWCGKGVAMRAKGLGAKVIVCEIDPIKASEAWMDGFLVMPMNKAAKIGDFFITVTGCNNVIRKEHFTVMKDGVVLANAGHFDVEISKPDLESIAVKIEEMRPNIRKYELEDKRRIYLLADGRLVNLAAADGHPVEIMDMSFALQVLSLLYILDNSKNLNKSVYNVPKAIDEKVAYLKLTSLGLSIDQLSLQQEEYLQGWKF